MVSVYGYPPALISDVLDRLRPQTAGCIGANFILHFVDPDQVQECVAAAAASVRVVDFFYTDPDAALVEIVHRQGALACWQVGSKEEAAAAVAAGCDFIIAQGIEAGGHVRGQIGMLALLSEVLDTVDVPVLAAGGIGTGRAMAAALAAGADGVRIGTRLIAAEEAEAHPTYVKALIAARPQDTIYTEAFPGSWPINAPHRVLRSCLEAAEAFQGEVVGEGIDYLTGEQFPLKRFGTRAVTKSYTGTIEAMWLAAGESVGGVKKIASAADIMHDMTSEAEHLLRRWC
jgi:NAD(P)H-dependent flavin oxidoreductase YrpB (nitropropane dioxygenase family)